jgi:hypothetical protein
MPVLFVHGRAQEKRDQSALHKAWRESLFKVGFERADVPSRRSRISSFFPYYGDELVQGIKGKRKRRSHDEDSVRAIPHQTESGDLFEELLEELAAIAVVRARASGIEVVERQRRGKEENPADMLRGVEDSTRSLTSVLGAIHAIVPSVSDAALAVLKDVSAYLCDNAIHDAVQRVVAEEYARFIKDSNDNLQPRVVVAHSLGTVVAIDLLNKNRCDAIDLFVTLGAPLGLDGIRRRLRNKPFWPKNVKRWINASDSRDIVAMIPVLGRNGFFLDDYTKNKNARCDVLNLTDVDNTTDNHHGITGYLDDPGVARVIAECFAGIEA